MLIHSVSYAASTMVAFMVLLAVWQQTGKEGVRDLAGMARRNPFLALALTGALFSLAGFPFFVGFASKFYLFTVVATAGTRFLVPVGIAIFASLISLYYYLNIVRQMYIEQPEDGAQADPYLADDVAAHPWLAADDRRGRAVREAVGGGRRIRGVVDIRRRVGKRGEKTSAIVHSGSVAQ